ncbi:trypsin-like peptidase domain-containing protein [Patescibacteria group bacterium]|nr:trypsin-like peptidase domain-containing protein [Patescibacteria group bacterium]
MIFEKLPNHIKQALIITVIISITAGGLVGGIVGILLAGYSSKNLWPYVSDSLGLNDQISDFNQNGQNIINQAVVEDSAATQVVEQASGAVVSIIVTQDLSEFYNKTGPMYLFYSMPPTGKQEIGGGSGFIITTDGMIVTNRHVVDNNNAEYTVVLNDGTQYEAQVLARDDLNDIAIIKIEADNLPILDLGDSNYIKTGQTVIAIGNSLGEYRNTVTKGVISGINRRVVAGDSVGFSEVIEEAVQTDAAINSGNSGGPLIDLFGKVIGVNTAVSRQGQLIGFAIPINSVKSVIDSVREYGRIVRPFLGVRYVLLNEEIAKANNIIDISYGALIVRGEIWTDLAIVPGSPANKAGIVENDIILEINGEKITQENGLAKIIAKYKPNDTVRLKVYHKGEEKEVEAVLVERE